MNAISILKIVSVLDHTNASEVNLRKILQFLKIRVTETFRP